MERTWTHPPPEAEYKLERVRLRVIPQMPLWVKFEGLGVQVLVVGDCPDETFSRTPADAETRHSPDVGEESCSLWNPIAFVNDFLRR